MNVALLERLTAQPWAIERRALPALAQLVIGGREQKMIGRDPEARAASALAIAARPGYVPLSIEAELGADSLPPLPPGVEVILAWGLMGRGWTAEEKCWLNAIDVDEIAAAVAASTAQKTVIWWRSPGGIVTGVPEVGDQLAELVAGGKRLFAFTDDLCCSAAYWLAAQSWEIHATATAELGGIGVYIAFYDYSRFLEKMGIDLALFKAGRLKGTGVMGNPLSDEAADMLQKRVDESYERFVSAVTGMRAVADEAMQGQTFQGEEALGQNLCDRLHRSAAEFLGGLGTV